MDDIEFGDSDSEDDYEDSEDGLEDHSFSKANPLRLLTLALERSQDHPLEVTLEFGMSHADSDEENGPAAQMRRMGLHDSSTSTLHSDLIRAVVAHSNRWKTAELQLTSALITRFAPIRNRLSLLTKLTVSVFSFEGTAREFPYTKIAPRLTDVTLNSYPHEKISLPWSSLRHFSATRLLLPRRGPPANLTATCLKLLRDNPRLESLDVAYPSPPPSSAQSTLTHRSLRRLLTVEESLIRSLTLPQLEELVVRPKNDDTMSAIRGLLVRSNCTLRSLRLIDFSLDDLVILSQTPGLQTLILRLTGWHSGHEETMKGLMARLAEASFLPCLQDLDIIISQDYEMDSSVPLKAPSEIGFIDDAFVEMLEARWERRGAAQNRAYLQRVFVLVELPATLSLSKVRGVSGLRKMCDEGLDVFLRARDPRALDLEQDATDISYVYDM